LVSRLKPTLSGSEEVYVDTNDHKGNAVLFVSKGLTAELAKQAEALPEGERAAFRRRTLALVVARTLAGLWTDDRKQADRDAVAVTSQAGFGGPPVEREVKAAISLLTKSRGLEIECNYRIPDIGPMKCDFVPAWKSRSKTASFTPRSDACSPPPARNLRADCLAPWLAKRQSAHTSSRSTRPKSAARPLTLAP
jgi:hypothetical protein